MRCPGCGLENPDSYIYCPRCGINQSTPQRKLISIDQSAIKNQREEVYRAIQRRTDTDWILSPSWIWLLVIIMVVSAISIAAVVFRAVSDRLNDSSYTEFDKELFFDDVRNEVAVIIPVNFVFYGVAACLAYLLVDRLNKHFAREKELRASIASLVSSAASSPELRVNIVNELSQMNEENDRSDALDKKRKPLFWGLAIALPIIPSSVEFVQVLNGSSYSQIENTNLMLYFITIIHVILLFYLLYFLVDSIRQHDSRWVTFEHHSTIALSKLGLPVREAFFTAGLYRRSVVLYIVLSIITLGFFVFYWWHASIGDANRHFEAQWHFEDGLVSALGQQPRVIYSA